MQWRTVATTQLSIRSPLIYDHIEGIRNYKEIFFLLYIGFQKGLDLGTTQILAISQQKEAHAKFSNTTNVGKNVNFNQVHGRFMLLLSYFPSHYALLDMQVGKKNLKILKVAIREYKTKWAKNEKVDMRVLDEWESKLLHRIKSR